MALYIIIAVIILINIRVIYELHHIKVTEYVVCANKGDSGDGGVCHQVTKPPSPSVTDDKQVTKPPSPSVTDDKQVTKPPSPSVTTTDRLLHSFVFISDLHHRRYGKDNEKLIALVKSQKPDFILLGGDMTTAKPRKNDEALLSLLEKLSKIAPVFYASGNHEREMMEYPELFGGRFEAILAKCRECGVRYLSNECVELDERTTLFALDCEYRYYDKKDPVDIDEKYIKDKLNITDKTSYNILLSHNPKFFEAYEKAGFDLVLSGHYHGGAVRFGRRGVISPQFRLFPAYSYGRYEKGKTTMIVTGGAGSHTLNLRLFNLPEVLNIKITGAN